MGTHSWQGAQNRVLDFPCSVMPGSFPERSYGSRGVELAIGGGVYPVVATANGNAE